MAVSGASGVWCLPALFVGKVKCSPPWENPSLLGINKRAPHAPLRSHTTSESAINWFQLGGQNTYQGAVVHLSGREWDFKLFPNPATVPEAFWEDPDQTWGKVPVPSSWEMQGHSTPIYTNFIYPMPREPPFVPEDDNPTGCFRTTFTTPAQVVDGTARAFLTFEGADSFLSVWVNGEFVGMSKDSRLPAEFEVTELLKSSGGNVLAVQVVRWSDASYLEDQDMWRLSGLHRHVYLHVRPTAVHITDYQLSPRLVFNDGQAAPKLANGHGHEAPQGELQAAYLDVTVYLEGVSEVSLSSAQLHLHLYASSDTTHPLTTQPLELKVRTGRWYAADTCSGGVRRKRMCGAVAKASIDMRTVLGGALPKLWCAEQPNLYLAVLQLTTLAAGGAQGSADSVTEYESAQVGFRHTCVRGGQLYHNNRPVMIRGVNRHEWDHRLGKVVSEEHMVRDILLMKRHNLNAMRCSHYPNNIRWYELCNTYGLYIVDETNLETHGFDPTFQDNAMNPACTTVWSAAILDRGIRMYERTKNQPCITLWSLGNEAGHGPVHDALAAWLRARDPTRPIHYEGGGSRTPATDVVCPMYPRVPQLKSLLQQMAQEGDHRPLLLCEYAHSMGNSTGNLDAYWDLFESSDQCSGGFIWDWADQCPVRKVTMARKIEATGEDQEVEVEYWAVGGDYGDTPNDAQFCANGLVFPDRTPHPCLAEAQHVMAPVKVSWPTDYQTTRPPHPQVTVTNRYDTLTTDHVQLQWRLVADGQPVAVSVAGQASVQRQLRAVTDALGSWAPMVQEGTGAARARGGVTSVLAAGYAAEHPGPWPGGAAGGAGAEEQGWLVLRVGPVGPRGQLVVNLPCSWDKLDCALKQAEAVESWLEFRVLLAADTQWAPAGHHLATYQLPVPPATDSATSNSQTPSRIPPVATKLLQTVAEVELPTAPTITGQLTVVQDPNAPLITVQGPQGLTVEFDAAMGVLQGLSKHGKSLLQSPLVPCMFRACTDNDRGGSGGTSYAARWIAAGLDRLEVEAGTPPSVTVSPAGESVTVSCSYSLVPRPQDPADTATLTGAGVGEVGGAHWFASHDNDDTQPAAPAATDLPAASSLPALEPTPGPAAAAPVSAGQVEQHAALQALSETPGAAGAAVAVEDGVVVDGAGTHIATEGVVRVKVSYQVHWDGLVDTDWEVDATAALPAPLKAGLSKSLPRVGVTTSLTPDLDHVTWHGRGPHECYPDRQHSAPVGLYQGSVRGMHVPYVFPQENGGRTGVRWLLLRPSTNHLSTPSTPTASAVGLAAFPTRGSAPMQMNVSPYSVMQLHAATHEFQLHGLQEVSDTRVQPPLQAHTLATHLVLDHVHMGVGGDDSWSPSVHPEYLVAPAVYQFSVGLLPVQLQA